MRLRKISLRNFRNLRRVELLPAEDLNIIVGSNASGKTNLCEAIYYASLETLLKGDRQSDLITWGEEYTLMEFDVDGDHLKIYLNGNERSKTVEVNLKRHLTGRLYDHMRVVSFTPDDLHIIKGSPKGRRRFLDSCICELDPEYRYNLRKYKQVVRRKNALLKKAWLDQGLKEVLNGKLAELGAILIKGRLEYIHEVNQRLSVLYRELREAKGCLQLKYHADLAKFPYEDLESIRMALSQNIEKEAHQEEQRGFSLVGPHRDDLNFSVDGVDMRKYGSQGEQKLCIIALKLAQLELHRERLGEYPILIMDDVVSELDCQRMKLLLDNLPSRVQIFLTYTEITEPLRNLGGQLYRVEGGSVLRIDCKQP